MRYTFEKIENCNMCCSSTSSHKMIGRRLNRAQGFFPRKRAGITTTIFKCNSCNLIYANPLPVPIDLQDHYGVLPESYWTESYLKMQLDISALIVKLKNELDFSRNLKALDIGAGVGKMMKAMELEGFESFGIEPSMQFYRKALEVNDISDSHISCVSIEQAEFEPNTFDFITFGAVLEHLKDPAHSIEKSMRWLKPGGIIQVQVPSSQWLIAKVLNFLYKVRFSDFCANLSPMHSPYHLYEFDKKSFQAHALKNDYEIIDVQYEVCATFLPKVFDPLLRPIMKKTNTGMEIYVLLKKKG